MVSYNRDWGSTRKEWAGLSTDTKPTDGVGNGDVFLEIDTGDVFVFDAENEAWEQVT